MSRIVCIVVPSTCDVTNPSQLLADPRHPASQAMTSIPAHTGRGSRKSLSGFSNCLIERTSGEWASQNQRNPKKPVDADNVLMYIKLLAERKVGNRADA